jgi:hypothetical protein
MIKIESKKILYPDAFQFEVEKFFEVNPEQKAVKIRRIKFVLSEQQRNELLNCALNNNPKHYIKGFATKGKKFRIK